METQHVQNFMQQVPLLTAQDPQVDFGEIVGTVVARA